MKLSNAIIFLCIFASKLYGQELIQGTVVNAATGETIPGVRIQVSSNLYTTNNYGHFSFFCNVSDTLTFSCVGFETQKIVAAAEKARIVYLQEATLELNEVVVSNSRQQDVATIRLSTQQIKEMPTLLGEKDLVKSIQMLPGVQKPLEGTNTIQVRGGTGDQNLLLLDNAIVYNPNHLFGLFSTFNADAIKSLDFQKGGFDAKYGGRLSSVIDVSGKDGNFNAFSVSGGIGLLSSRLLVEGPIVKDKVSFLIAGRRSYLEPILGYLQQGQPDEEIFYNFYDVNVKLNYRINQNNAVYLSKYRGNDNLWNTTFDNRSSIYGKNALKWGNDTYSLRWTSTVSPRLFLYSTFVTTSFKNKMGEYTINVDKEPVSSESYQSEISEQSAEISGEYSHSQVVKVSSGLFAKQRLFIPQLSEVISHSTETETIVKNKIKNLELGGYFQTEWQVGKVSSKIGVRSYLTTIDTRNYFLIEPRIQSSFNATQKGVFKLAYSRSNQTINQLPSSNLGLPTDFWIPSVAKFGPSTSDQLDAGWSKEFRKFLLSVELYGKSMTNILAVKDGVRLLSIESKEPFDWENKFTSGNGMSTGLEFLVRRETGKLTGWVAYSLSRTVHRFTELNGGKPFYPANDRRHDVSVVTSWKPKPRLRISGTFVYTSGSRINIPVGIYNVWQSPLNPYSINEYASFSGLRNSSKLPDYHRMDVSLEFKSKSTKRFKQSFEIGVYNVYNRRNAFNYTLARRRADNMVDFSLRIDSLLPILPFFTYNFSL